MNKQRDACKEAHKQTRGGQNNAYSFSAIVKDQLQLWIWCQDQGLVLNCQRCPLPPQCSGLIIVVYVACPLRGYLDFSTILLACRGQWRRFCYLGDDLFTDW
eukprot:1990381-Amphidinium_carterae.1